ncbi:MAG: citrate/2-methylcitrate synthase, partial [Spongiibacter sp.]|nr:citrate/2-methylcitrate synthase [Spongiibacter sp.]
IPRRQRERLVCIASGDALLWIEGFPPNAHPMSVLSTMVASLSTFYPDYDDEEIIDKNVIRLLAKLKTLAAFAHKKSIGQPYIYPRNDLDFIGDFLHMMFAVPAEPYEINDTVRDALDLLLILHADHEQNCSTSTVRMVGSSGADLFSSISAGVSALSGPLHGGANQAVIQMLEGIQADGGDYAKYIEKAKDKNDPFRLMGFGHRVYKNFDPRAKVMKQVADEVLGELGIDDPLLKVAKRLEQIALEDPYFVEKKLYPNVDFYSGIILKAIGIPTSMFTVIFALGRTPGWIAHWSEMHASASRIGRPRQLYTGPEQRDFVKLEDRD